MEIEFFGVRGSTPCCSPETARYGGNTSCVVVTFDDDEPILLDLGTGLRMYGLGCCADTFVGSALISHLHWDHVQGVPFFTPMLTKGSSMTVYGPSQVNMSFREAIDAFLQPPFFPVCLNDLDGHFECHEVNEGYFDVGKARVLARSVPHNGPTLGFRIERRGKSIAYISDHQQPGCEATVVDPNVLELADNVDVLIHDAQYNDDEFAKKFDWGHCTANYAATVAQQASAKTLVLFHHDPGRNDDDLDADVARLEELYRDRVPLIVAAREGLKISP